MGLKHTVTRSAENTIYEIDGKPSMEVFRHYLNEDEFAEWGKIQINVPLGLEAPRDMSGYDQYLVRALMQRAVRPVRVESLRLYPPAQVVNSAPTRT
jgi:hypothetical protein